MIIVRNTKHSNTTLSILIECFLSDDCLSNSTSEKVVESTTTRFYFSLNIILKHEVFDSYIMCTFPLGGHARASGESGGSSGCYKNLMVKISSERT